MTAHSELSVVVPVKDGAETIIACLDSLLSQEEVIPKIIVVNNGSTDATEYLTQTRPVTLVNLSKPSVYLARNVGIKKTQSWAVGFTDADCIVSPRWGVTLLRELQKEGVGGVGGAICSHPDDNWIGYYEGQHLHPQFSSTTAGGYAHRPYLRGANMMYRREALESVGLFDADLFSGGDTDLGWRVSGAGWAQHYVEGAEVFHRGSRTIEKFYWQAYRYGRGNRTLWQKHNLPIPWGEKRADLYRNFLSLLSREKSFPERALDFIRSAAFFTGMTAGPWR